MIKPNGEIVPPIKCSTCMISGGCSWECIRGDDLVEIYVLRRWAEDEQAKRHRAEEQRTEARGEVASLLASLTECLPQLGWKNYSDEELRREAELGNGRAPIILRARGAIAKAGVRPALIPNHQTPNTGS